MNRYTHNAALDGVIVGGDDLISIGVLLVATAASARLGEAVLLEVSELLLDLGVEVLFVVGGDLLHTLLAVGSVAELLDLLSLSQVNSALAATAGLGKAVILNRFIENTQ